MEGPRRRDEGPSPNASIEGLLAKVQRGDARAFRDLVETNAGWVIADCRHLSGSEADAHDLSQEVFVKSYFRLTQLDRIEAFGPWLRRIKVNHCLSFLRKERRVQFVEIDEAHELTWSGDSPERTLEIREDRERIDVVLAQLTDTLRVPLVMHDMDGMTHREIAAALEVGESAVRMRVMRARAEFKRRWLETESTASDE